MDNHGHKVMADVLIAYTQRQICAVERERRQPHVFLDRSKGLLPGTENLEEIPRVRYEILSVENFAHSLAINIFIH